MLTKLGQITKAKEVLQQTLEAGFKGNKFHQLGELLHKDPVQPSKEQLDQIASLFMQGKFQEALAEGNILAAKFPNNSIIINFLGIGHSGLKQYDEAISCFRKAIDISPKYANACYNFEIMYYEILDDMMKQYPAMEKAIELKPDFAEAYNNVSNVLIALKRYEEAILNCRKAISYNPMMIGGLSTLGNVLKNLGRHMDAISSFDDALKLNPEFSAAYNNRELPTMRYPYLIPL